MRFASLIFLLLGSLNLNSQRVVNKEIHSDGHILLTEDITIPKINNGYTLWLPDKGKTNGLVIFTHSRRDTAKSDPIINHALDNQLAVLYATTQNRLEFFFDQEQMQEIESYIHEVISTYNIPAGNMMYCGMSLEGTRALKLAIFGQSSNAKYKLKPRAIAVCDAPLDMVRFHKEMNKAKELEFNAITTNEGTWVTGYLEQNLGGTPEDNVTAYIDYSPYCYLANGGPHLDVLKDIAIRAYTEPDVNWWIETRRKDYYSMNAIDLAALVNELKVRNNQYAELIITQNKGYHPDGQRHPHSWSIVDEKELIEWFVEMIK